jgi:hypothetical protein
MKRYINREMAERKEVEFISKCMPLINLKVNSALTIAVINHNSDCITKADIIRFSGSAFLIEVQEVHFNAKFVFG